MKQFMIDMMGMMMPHMKLPLYVGIALAVVGFLLFLWRLFTSKGPMLGTIAWGLIALGAFYIICELMGKFLGMRPVVAFGGNPAEFDFGTRVAFWKLGAALLAPGLVFLITAKMRKS